MLKIRAYFRPTQYIFLKNGTELLCIDKFPLMQNFNMFGAFSVTRSVMSLTLIPFN